MKETENSRLMGICTWCDEMSASCTFIKVSGNPEARFILDDIYWLLDLVKRQDARIVKLREALSCMMHDNICNECSALARDAIAEDEKA